jgi:hypothetical protein
MQQQHERMERARKPPTHQGECSHEQEHITALQSTAHVLNVSYGLLQYRLIVCWLTPILETAASSQPLAYARARGADRSFMPT